MRLSTLRSSQRLYHYVSNIRLTLRRLFASDYQIIVMDARSIPPLHSQQSSTPSAATVPSCSIIATGIGGKRRIRFSKSFDILLLKSVITVDAHLARHGETQTRFLAALTHFTAGIPARVLDTFVSISWKTINDRFKKVVADHREAVKINTTASGIIEVRGEREELLDDIILAMDEMEETRRAE